MCHLADASEPLGAIALQGPNGQTSDISDLQETLEEAREGRREAEGIFLHTYQVNDRIEIEAGLRWNNR